MSARYILRLDDACPTMRAESWSPIESLLVELNIRPLVGVIPDNRDPSLICSPADPNFWERVRLWQDNGWDIALHGLHHVYHPIPPDSHSILDLAKQSEFVGLDLAEQKRRITTGVKIMSAAGVHPRIFMAPSHTFDKVTLQALREASDIRCIADGHSLGTYLALGVSWIPQQLWRFKDLPFGLWCICLHPNTMNQADLDKISADLRRHAHHFIDARTAMRDVKRRTPLDYIFSAAYRVALKVKRSRHDD